jgi:hypothetical protein
MPFRALIAQAKADASARLAHKDTLVIKIERSMTEIERGWGNRTQLRQTPSIREWKAHLDAR